MIKHYFAIYITLCCTYSALPQVNYRLYAESGYFNSKETNNSNYSKLLSRLYGEISYQYTDESRTAGASLNLNPEMYGTKDPQNILKAKITGGYFQQDENLGWGLNITKQKNIYNIGPDHYNYDLFMIRGETEWNIFPALPFSFYVGYAFQETGQQLYQYYDIIFIDAKAYSEIFQEIKAGYGLYIEKFSIQNKLNNSTVLRFEDSNRGTRWGPQISLNYIHHLIFNFEYNFLFHNSLVTESLSYEQLIRLVLGTVFLNDFSAFILVDYYKRDLKFKSSFNEATMPVYVPMNLENRIYLKLGYDVSEITEFYIKTGYLKENLYNRYSFSGWHVLAGIQISN